jgi:flagellar motility protein MotE (MotC chaperone)
MNTRSAIRFAKILFGLTALSLILSAPTSSRAIASDHAPAGKKSEKKGEDIAVPPLPSEPEQPLAEQYCASVQEAAASAQIALQKKELEKALNTLEQGTKRAEAKIEELKTWMKRRDEFLAQARENVTAIYAKMPAEAAAARILAMNELVAAALLSKLPPKGASAILAEMDSVKAARLSSLLAGAADVTEKSAPTSPKATP